MKRFAWLLLAMPVALFALGCENKTDEGNEEQPTEPKIETGEPMKAPPTGETGNGETDNKPAEEKPAGENGDAGTSTPDKDAPQPEGTDGAGTDNPDASKVDIEAPKNP